MQRASEIMGAEIDADGALEIANEHVGHLELLIVYCDVRDYAQGKRIIELLSK